MSRPRLLDLFCGAGGAAMGYHRAGFDVVGVDIKPQQNYPFEFHQADAMTFPLEGYDAIHASPPCQGYSIMRNLPWLRDRDYPLLIDPTRALLMEHGGLWVIENVEHARRAGMSAGFLCGQMFGLPIIRHRLFETNWPWLAPAHPRHAAVVARGRMLGGRADPSRGMVSLSGGLERSHRGERREASAEGGAAHFARVQAAMGIDWMKRGELAESIPPVYTEYIGKQLMAVLE